MKILAAVTTVGNRDDARRIAAAVVEQRLAACAQLSAIESVYRWDGALQQESEVRLVFKTTAERYPALEAAIRRLHPYTLPEIHAVALDAVHAPYAQWVADETTPR